MKNLPVKSNTQNSVIRNALKKIDKDFRILEKKIQRQIVLVSDQALVTINNLESFTDGYKSITDAYNRLSHRLGKVVASSKISGFRYLSTNIFALISVWNNHVEYASYMVNRIANTGITKNGKRNSPGPVVLSEDFHASTNKALSCLGEYNQLVAGLKKDVELIEKEYKKKPVTK